MTPSPDIPRESEPNSYAHRETGLFGWNRLGGLAAALLIEALVLLLLLTLGWGLAEPSDPDETLTTISAQSVSAEVEEPDSDAPDAEAEPQTQPDPIPPEQSQPEIEPPPQEPEFNQRQPASRIPNQAVTVPQATIPPPRQPAPPRPPTPPARTYGPPNTAPNPSSMDSARVGTRANGDPIYAARWYREPTERELAGYLSTATGPASALIVCRTVPNWGVEDCELLGESPQGSQIGRAVLAAAWQFRVRPAIIGGRSQVGSWVRIRIDYNLRVRR